MNHALILLTRDTMALIRPRDYRRRWVILRTHNRHIRQRAIGNVVVAGQALHLRLAAGRHVGRVQRIDGRCS